MKKPRLNILRTFDVAAEALSFSMAAEQLNISQAAVSQQMRDLESYLGTALFIRHNRRLSLSPAGKSYHRAVHETIERLDLVTDQLFPDKADQRVKLHCTPSVATLWLAPKLGTFHKAHPEIDLQVNTLDLDLGNSLAGFADLEISLLSAGEDPAHSSPLIQTKIVPVCTPDFLHRFGPIETPDHLQDLNLIHVLGYDDDWHRWFRKFGKGNPKALKGLSVDGSLFALETVLRGDGVMLGRRPFIDNYLKKGELAHLFQGRKMLHAEYVLKHSAKGRSSRAVLCVIDWLLVQGNAVGA